MFFGDEKTKKLLKRDEETVPVSMQIFGSDPETMGFAAQYVSKLADIVDINMGCPAPKVVKNGDGSKLLLDLNKAEEIIKSVVKNSTKPVTLKFRKGWNDENIVACELAKIAEKCGVSAITIHGRTREEYYSGKADLDIIKTVKESVKIPVIGNGDIRDIQSAKKMFEYTHVDGIMIGRASLGNPWIFKNIIKGLQDETLKENKDIKKFETENEITLTERLEVILEHLNLVIEEKGEYVGIREMRKHISGYTKKLPNSSEFRQKMNTIESKEELVNFITEYINNLEHINKEE